jgi:hypothetical protein
VLTIEGEDEGADVKFEVRLRVSYVSQRAARIDDYRTFVSLPRTDLTSFRFRRLSTATSDFGAGEAEISVIPGRFGSRLRKVKADTDQVCGSAVVFCVPMHSLPNMLTRFSFHDTCRKESKQRIQGNSKL